MKKRIWELDALRGLCMFGVVAVHLIFDLEHLYGLLQWEHPAVYDFIQEWGGVLFLLISGICVTLGEHHIKRGLFVLGFGMALTAVTWGMEFFGFARGVVIWFGVLHCLGICMLLWAPLRKVNHWALLLMAAVLIAGGFWMDAQPPLGSIWLIPFGWVSEGFFSADYFPLLPNLGFFLLGAVLGKTLYKEKTSLLPNVNEDFFILRFLRFCGRNSLWIYLFHQPILAGICALLTLTRS